MKGQAAPPLELALALLAGVEVVVAAGSAAPVVVEDLAEVAVAAAAAAAVGVEGLPVVPRLGHRLDSG